MAVLEQGWNTSVATVAEKALCFHMLRVIACPVPLIGKIRSLENICKVVKPHSGVAEGLLVSFSITVWDSLDF